MIRFLSIIKKFYFTFGLPFAFGFVTASLPAQFAQAPVVGLDITVEPERLEPGGSAGVEVTYSFPPGTYQLLQPEYFFVAVEPQRDFNFVPGPLPEGQEKAGITAYRGEVSVSGRIQTTPNISPGEHRISIQVGYQVCDDAGVCYLPETEEFILTVTVISSTTQIESVAFTTVLRYLLLAFLGGIILNFMPCVLPVLSVKALSLVKQSHTAGMPVRLGALLYAAGILVTLVILALIAVGLKVSGELVGWGFQFQNPGYVIALASVIFIFALSLFDVFVITVPGTKLAALASKRSGGIASVLNGALAVLLATPCAAPVLGAVLGFAFSQPPWMIVAVFLSVGVGLAMPFVLLSLRPGLINKIPKPGHWVTILREAMGFLLIFTLIWLLDVLLHQIGERLVNVLLFLGSLGVAAWVFGRFRRPDQSRATRWVAAFAALAVAAAGGAAFLRFDTAGIDPTEAVDASTMPVGWERFSPETLTAYLQEGQPVFIDFTARWCLTCRLNETTVLFTRKVKEAFEIRNVKLLRGDYTTRDEVVGEWIEKFGKAGVPVYAYYAPGALEPVVLPELLTKLMILNLVSPEAKE